MSAVNWEKSRWTARICRFSSAREALGRRPGNHWIFQKVAVIVGGDVAAGVDGESEGVGWAKRVPERKETAMNCATNRGRMAEKYSGRLKKRRESERGTVG